ncbi:hypothetical protein [uncultured Clostridium sp.]|uniref:hypothetical protein n=1 Tax=uncultured Clostridium sp. TaxID=59620 RepID=UPI0026EA300B|nr:hypothetical protein [uncultured Clostridium sp.]
MKSVSYVLNLYDKKYNLLEISWEYPTESKALEIYNERKNMKEYVDLRWELVKVETTSTVLDITKLY